MSEKWTELIDLLNEKRFVELKERLNESNEVDIADFFSELPLDQATKLFRMLKKDKATDVFACLDVDKQQHIISAATDKELVDLISDLFVDDIVDMMEELPATVVRRILETATSETRKTINQYLNYPENSAGSIMTAELMNLKHSFTVREAFARIREKCSEKEDVYTCFVTDENRVLQGVVTVKQMLMARDDDLIGDIMTENFVSAVTTDDREHVVELIKKYGLLSLPVVDKESRLVGIITVDDAVDILTQEATEDITLMAAVSPSEKPYLKSGVVFLARNRIVWLLVLMLSSTLTGIILSNYEAAFAAVPLLVTFIPMLTDTGGNAGSQSSALIIRGLALGEIKMSDFFAVVWKEARVSLLVGVALSTVNYFRILIMYPDKAPVAFVVALSLLATVIIAKVIGGILPLFAKLIRTDPAIMAAPLITTIVDALSLVIYFGIASSLLKI
ncbi:MAG: magnesium transporter [Oscillospiraceae bacterium]|nr:magnesium transporter [Oscillospiraceae bacterium]